MTVLQSRRIWRKTCFLAVIAFNQTRVRRLSFNGFGTSRLLSYKPSMTPRELVQLWVQTFNRADAEGLASFYADDAVNHQVAEAPVHGKAAIRQMFTDSFATATMVCIVENIFEDGQWAILEWRDPLGLRGCGFFHVVGDKIVFQRGYWDKLTFLRQQGLPLPNE